MQQLKNLIHKVLGERYLKDKIWTENLLRDKQRQVQNIWTMDATAEHNIKISS